MRAFLFLLAMWALLFMLLACKPYGYWLAEHLYLIVANNNC